MEFVIVGFFVFKEFIFSSVFFYVFNVVFSVRFVGIVLVGENNLFVFCFKVEIVFFVIFVLKNFEFYRGFWFGSVLNKVKLIFLVGDCLKEDVFFMVKLLYNVLKLFFFYVYSKFLW